MTWLVAVPAAVLEGRNLEEPCLEQRLGRCRTDSRPTLESYVLEVPGTSQVCDGRHGGDDASDGGSSEAAEGAGVGPLAHWDAAPPRVGGPQGATIPAPHPFLLKNKPINRGFCQTG